MSSKKYEISIPVTKICLGWMLGLVLVDWFRSGSVGNGMVVALCWFGAIEFARDYFGTHKGGTGADLQLQIIDLRGQLNLLKSAYDNR